MTGSKNDGHIDLSPKQMCERIPPGELHKLRSILGKARDRFGNRLVNGALKTDTHGTVRRHSTGTGSVKTFAKLTEGGYHLIRQRPSQSGQLDTAARALKDWSAHPVFQALYQLRDAPLGNAEHFSRATEMELVDQHGETLKLPEWHLRQRRPWIRALHLHSLCQRLTEPGNRVAGPGMPPHVV